MTAIAPAFDLPTRLSAKADPALIADDEQRFVAIADCLRESIEEASVRLAAARRQPGGGGEAAMNRDIEIHQLTSRLRILRRFGFDACLGRMVGTDATEPVYIGRFGLTDRVGRHLLIDWRSPAAEPFFAATHANPMGLRSRRRYRWTRGRVSDYWDEVFTAEGLASRAALDDQSAFVASLGSSRSARMRDVLSTIQADQDAIIRADSRGALVVDGGPGTGKTVVALHRAAYLMYSDARIARGGSGVLFVGPSDAYLSYVDDVLPSLGEESVQISTIRGLVAEGADAPVEQDQAVARLKASGRLLQAVEAAVAWYERPPRHGLLVETEWADLELSAAEWAEAFDAADPVLGHNEAREQVWEALLDILTDRFDDEVPPHLARRALTQNDDLVRSFAQAWPLLAPEGIVADLWSVPAYLRACAPWLSETELRMLHRADARAWTVSDLPFLDAARQRVGDPDSARRSRRRAATLAAEAEEMARVVEHLIESDDSELQVMSMLRGQDLKNTLVDESVLPAVDPDRLAGPFAHVIVDEAQELTEAEWQMLVRRCPSRSFTVVGDRAQARHGFTEAWRHRLEQSGFDRIALASLAVNYRTPQEVMAEAEPVIRAALPDANVPTSIRSGGLPVRHGNVSDLDVILDEWLAEHDDGVACVISVSEVEVDEAGTGGASDATSRVWRLTPASAKGLEFDLVVLIDSDAFGSGIEGAVDRYVAMTRATQQLVILV